MTIWGAHPPVLYELIKLGRPLLQILYQVPNFGRPYFDPIDYEMTYFDAPIVRHSTKGPFFRFSGL